MEDEAKPLEGGEGPKKCGARKRGSAGYCGQAAGWGTDHPGFGHCKLHGGSTQGQRTKADRDRIDQAVRTELKRHDLTPVGDPLAQLQLLAAEVIRYQEILAAKVEEIGTWTYDDISDKEDLRAVLLAYERALDRTNNVLGGIVRLNIEERLAKVSEVQARMLIAVIEAVIEARELALTRDQRATARAIVAREIPRVTAGAT